MLFRLLENLDHPFHGYLCEAFRERGCGCGCAFERRGGGGSGGGAGGGSGRSCVAAAAGGGPVLGAARPVAAAAAGVIAVVVDAVGNGRDGEGEEALDVGLRCGAEKDGTG